MQGILIARADEFAGDGAEPSGIGRQAEREQEQRALAHMRSDEVLAYPGADYIVGVYSSLEMGAVQQETDVIPFFESHPKEHRSF